ncbi:putative Rho termination factor [Helianthus debilis subsp. tardiflorus]
MDGIWGPPYSQANEDTISFCHPYDVIEQTNINTECCIHVLEILLSKADTEIVEHEAELMDLLSQLACTDEVFSNMFSTSLRAKIDFLDSSIRKLKDDAQGFLSTCREPAESIDDILKSLFCHYLQKKDLQFADNTGTASSSYSQVPADTQKKQFGSSSNANQLEKFKTVSVTPVEKPKILPAIVKVEEESIDDPHTSSRTKYSLQSLCWGSRKKTGIEVSKFQIKGPIIMKKDILHNMTPRCNSICPKPSLETKGKRKHQLSIIKSQTSDEGMRLATVLYDESMSLATVPYVQSSEETNAMSLAAIPYVESNEEANANLKELEFPPGYPKPQHHQKQSISHSQSRYSSSTYSRRKKSNSPLLTGSKSHLALIVSSPLDRAERYSKVYKEDYYTVSDLRAIAKQREIKGYYKLRKAELAQILGIKLINGRKKQPNKSETQLVRMIKCEP